MSWKLIEMATGIPVGFGRICINDLLIVYLV
jgi:hypothetical protein